jgi:hypothetical protein
MWLLVLAPSLRGARIQAGARGTKQRFLICATLRRSSGYSERAAHSGRWGLSMERFYDFSRRSQRLRFESGTVELQVWHRVGPPSRNPSFEMLEPAAMQSAAAGS